MSNMADGLGMQPRVKEPDSPFVVPGMGVPVSPPADLAKRAREGIIQPLSIQFPPLIPDTSSPFPQPPGAIGQEPASWQYDFTALDGVTGISRATFPGVVNFQSSQSVPTVPVPVSQGGTGQTSLGNGFVVANSGVVGTLVSPLPVSNGGTGNGSLLAGIVTAPGAGAPFSTMTYADGTWTPTDLSGAGLTFTPTTARYLQIGGWVQITLDLTFPTTGSAATAYIGGLPVAPNPSFTGGTAIGTTNGSATCLALTAGTTPGFVFQNISGANMPNSTMSAHAVRFQFWYHI